VRRFILVRPAAVVPGYSVLLSLKWTYYVHHKKKNINWTITALLSLGSVPAALLTLWILHTIKKDITALNAIIKYSLGWALL
jgi:uncharacterized membrane protein YfcA